MHGIWNAGPRRELTRLFPYAPNSELRNLAPSLECKEDPDLSPNVSSYMPPVGISCCQLYPQILPGFLIKLGRIGYPCVNTCRHPQDCGQKLKRSETLRTHQTDKTQHPLRLCNSCDPIPEVRMDKCKML